MNFEMFCQFLEILAREVMEWLQNFFRDGQPDAKGPARSMADHVTAEQFAASLKINAMNDEELRREYRRMLTRNRVRRWREKQKRKSAMVDIGGSLFANADEYFGTVTGNAKNVTCNASVTECNAAVTEGNAFVSDHTEPATPGCAAVTEVNAAAAECNAAVTDGNDSVTLCNASAKKEKENEKRKKQRKELKKNKKTKTNIADAMPTSAREGIAASVTEMEKCNDGNVMAVATQKSETGNENNTAEPSRPQQKNAELIPTEKLPEAFRKVVMAWNQLPLEIKLSGLYPRLVKRLRNLFENYGEEQVHKAIESIANSPFLLGKSKNNRGWVVSFSWLTDPENLEKILEGQYLDKAANNWGARLFQQGDELLPLPEGFIGTVVY